MMLRKTKVLVLFVLLSFTVNAQLRKASLSSMPYSDDQRLLISDFIAGFEPPAITKPVTKPIEAWKTWITVENYAYGKDRGSLPMIADLDALHPYFQEKITQLISICKKRGIKLAIVESYRTSAKQNEYKALGKKYTKASGGHSKHQYGLAIDLVPVIDSVAQWDNARLWKKVGVLGEQLGLRWGGRWRTLYDPGHFEWAGGLSSYHLANGLFPKVPKSKSNPCLEEDLNELVENWKAWEIEQSTLASRLRDTNRTEVQPALQNTSESKPLASSKMK